MARTIYLGLSAVVDVAHVVRPVYVRRMLSTAQLIPLALALVAVICLPRPALGDQTSPATSDQEKESQTVVVYLVRHAEKSDDGTDDPPLSVAGRIRAEELRALLADGELTQIHTTDLKRTRETVRHIAEDAGLDLQLYDPRNLENFAETLRATPGQHLVSGHSNTTPALVAALGGDPDRPIDELEYDRLYIVVIQPGQPTVTTLLRFGEPYVEGGDFGLRSGSGGMASVSHAGHP